MGMNRDKFRGIVSGITTQEPRATPPAEIPPASTVIETQKEDTATEREGERTTTAIVDTPEESRRFAKRGRPKGTRTDTATGNSRKIKVSLFLSETLVNDLYEWAHADRIHPGEMFERALKPFHEKETKRRNAGKE